MSGARAVEGLQARWARAGFLPYPWWVPVTMDSCALLALVVTAAQRLGPHPVLPVLALTALAAVPWVAEFAGWRVPWPLFTAGVLGPMTALIAAYPVTYDAAALVLVMMTGHLAAMDRARNSAAAAATAAVAVVLLELSGRFDGSSFSVAALLVGWDVGFLLQYQQRQLLEQERRQAAGEERAAMEERQRIAREVHDVIAHSLSVTLLHLTAARRTLADDLAPAEGRAAGDVAVPPAVDLAEAVEALRDAERLGRQAMADIRRTVGLLGTGEDTTAPAAGLADVPALVEEFARAGLDVRYDARGDASRVAPTTALGVYRVVQESLSNVAKHQPTAQVLVRLDLDAEPCRLTVHSTLAEAASHEPQEPAAGGSGLRGMRERAELLGGTLTAGPCGGGWLVDLRFPAAPTSDREVPGPEAQTGRHGCPVAARRASVDRGGAGAGAPG